MTRTIALFAAILLSACSSADYDSAQHELSIYPGADDEEIVFDFGQRAVYGVARDLQTGMPLPRTQVCAQHTALDCTTTDRDGYWTLEGTSEQLAGSKDGQTILLRFDRPGYAPSLAAASARGWVTQVNALMIPDALLAESAHTVEAAPRGGTVIVVAPPTAPGAVEFDHTDDIPVAQNPFADRPEVQAIGFNVDPGEATFGIFSPEGAQCSIAAGWARDGDSVVHAQVEEDTVTIIEALCR